jgi:outer membrane usher protein
MATGTVRAALLLLGILGTGGIARSEEPAPAGLPKTSDPGLAMLLVSVSINGQPQPDTYLVARRGDAFFVRIDDLTTWRLRLPSVDPILLDGERFAPLASVGGVAVAFDELQQSLKLIAPPAAFLANRVTAAQALPQPTDSAFAAFFNYNLSIDYVDKMRVGAFVETGMSDDWGVVSNSMLLGNGTVYGRATRLDSYYMRDDPVNLTRLVIGDSVTDARDWSRQVRFGGVRIGTEFALQSSLLTFPTPSLAGSAAVPSNVELLVNGTQRFQTDVDQGPFSINQVPLVTGAGEVTLVIRDPLGIERRVKSSYYVSSRLLRAGLSAWSAEAGAERRDYGLRSFRYADPFVAGTYRRGLTDWITVEGRAEASGDTQMAGGGITMVMVPFGEFSLAAASSHGVKGQGFLYRAAFARNGPTWNVAFSYQRASRDYREIGVERESERIVEQIQAAGGITFGRMGTAGLSYTSLTYADGQRAQVLSGNYSLSVRDRAFVSVYAIHSRFSETGRDTSLGFNLTVPFGPRSSAYLQAGTDGTRAEVRGTPPVSGGWGYRLANSTGNNGRQQAEAQWRGDVGEMTAQVDHAGGQTGMRVTGRGGLLIADGALFPTRQMESGFAVVRVPDQADVRVYQENRLVGRTNARGTAIIPDLRPYEVNRLSISAADIPIDVRMPEDQLLVVPRYRGAVNARFVAIQEHPGTIIVVMPDGKPVEAGSGVSSGAEKSFVGNEGEVFLQNLHAGMVLTVDAAGGPCHVRLDALPDQVLPTIGPLPCVR